MAIIVYLVITRVVGAPSSDPKPAFVYTVGDIVYFNGDATEYTPQFYEAYGHLELPIVGIPGNHDGDTTDDPSRQPLDTFMANFCAPEPVLPLGNEEFNRDVQTQPYCDWALNLEPQAASVVLVHRRDGFRARRVRYTSSASVRNALICSMASERSRKGLASSCARNWLSKPKAAASSASSRCDRRRRA